VSLIWSVRLGRVISVPKKSTARHYDGPPRQLCQTIREPLAEVPNRLNECHYSYVAAGNNGGGRHSRKRSEGGIPAAHATLCLDARSALRLAGMTIAPGFG
jgi:hypothetical protein